MRKTNKDGEKMRFSRGAIEVTNRLHELGFDAHNAPKPFVLKIAAEVLHLLKPSGAVTPKKVTEVKAKGQKPKPPAVKPVPARTEPPAPAASPAPKSVKEPRKPKTEPVEATPATQAVVQASVPAAATPAPAKTEAPAQGPAVIATITPFVSVLALLLSACNLLKTFDRSVGNRVGG